jgi:steroid 5-alpha reductase family enzyme
MLPEQTTTVIAQLLECLRAGNDLTAVAALSVVAILTLVPLTLVKNGYCFTVGYGASVATMAGALLVAFHESIHGTNLSLTIAAVLYGIRLSVFLLYREWTVSHINRQTKEFDDQQVSRALPVAVMLAILYACMVSLVLFALRSQEKLVITTPLSVVGALMAYLGLVMEAVADQEKLRFKRQHKVRYGHAQFVSPTTGLYMLCRHPNYTGEVVFWTGIFLGGRNGSTTAASDVIGWICGTIGWVSIVSIMLGSAKRLDRKQTKLYGGQRDYENWKRRVRFSLIPSLPRNV